MKIDKKIRYLKTQLFKSKIQHQHAKIRSENITGDVKKEFKDNILPQLFAYGEKVLSPTRPHKDDYIEFNPKQMKPSKPDLFTRLEKFLDMHDERMAMDAGV